MIDLLTWTMILCVCLISTAGCSPQRAPAPPTFNTNALSHRALAREVPASGLSTSPAHNVHIEANDAAHVVISGITAFAASIVPSPSSIGPDISSLTISQAHMLVSACLPIMPHTFDTASSVSKRCRSFEAGSYVLSSLFYYALSDVAVPRADAAYLGREYIRFCIRHKATADALALCDYVEQYCAADPVGVALVKENRIIAHNIAGDFVNAEKAARDFFLSFRDQPAQMPDGSPLSYYLDALINAGKYRAARKLVDTLKTAHHPWAQSISPARELTLRKPPANKIQYTMPFEQ